MRKNPGIRDLRGQDRRTFLRLVGAAGAAFGLERSHVLNYLFDEGGGDAVAGTCPGVCRSVHLIGGNGSFAWFQQLWPHIDVATTTDPGNQATFAYYAYGNPGTLYQPPAPNNPFYYAPDAPWMNNGTPTYPVSAFMVGQNETHTQTPTTPANVSTGSSMLATVASIQCANPVMLPVIGVVPLNFGVAPGAPGIATVPNAAGMVALFNSAASQLTLKATSNAQLFETYYRAVLGLRDAAGRPTWSEYLDTTKTGAFLVGQNLSTQLTPTAADLAAYGVTALATSNIGAPGQAQLTNFGTALITASRAFKNGLTNSVIIGMSPGATSETTFTDPHAAFDASNTKLRNDTVKYLGMMLTAFYADLATAQDPACSGTTLDKNTILTVHGDTPHDPLVQNAWLDATPGNSNWMYVMGGGYLRTGWFGQVHADASVDGFDPTSGATIPSPTSAQNNISTLAAGAAVAYAVSQGNTNLVSAYYSGPPYTGIVV